MPDASTGPAPVADLQSFLRPKRSTVRKAGITMLTVVVPVVVYFTLPLDREFGELIAALLVITAAASLIPISIRQAQMVLTSADPLFDAMRCIVSALVFLVISFSSAYFVLAADRTDQIQGLDTKLDGIYFTITILATVGFGDISATGQIARGVVSGQMVVNFAVLAVALRVITWALKERGPQAFVRRPPQTSDQT